ncbi:carbamate kinase [Oerskovia turbata]
MTAAQAPTPRRPIQRSVLVAIGGNALVIDGEAGSVPRQQARARDLAALIADLALDGWTVVVTHGNGPQVGYIVRRGELVAPEAAIEGLPELPLWLAVADSQGGIGHMLTLAIDSALAERGSKARAAAVLTHAAVDRDDPAFTHPTKPIGGQLTSDVARARVAQEGWTVTEVGDGVFRRVVASPVPQEILEAHTLRRLVDDGAIVVAAGGGGIPVVRTAGGYEAVDAVIDKDRASALLAQQIGIETLVLVTGVDQVYVDYGTPDQRALATVTASEMREHAAAGQFPAGSMGPKVESSVEFVERTGGRAVITSLPRVRDALTQFAGTHVVPTSSKEI